MKRRYRLHLETSFWKRLGDHQWIEARRLSYRFLNRACEGQETLISPLVIGELDATPDPEERRVICRQLYGVGPVVVSGAHRAEKTAAILRNAGGFGKRMFADLTHVAYAMMGAADAVVTWDRRTMAQDAVRRVVHAYCRREGLEAPLIGLPEDVTRWLGLKM